MPFNYTDINECITLGNKCMNGATCVDLVAGLSCVCAPGWTGYFCEDGKQFLCLLCDIKDLCVCPKYECY